MSRMKKMTVQDATIAVDEMLKEQRVDQVSAFLDRVIFEPKSLAPYRHFQDAHYTRNLIFKNDRFEMLAICWRSGQHSWIHNHQGQNCWMAMAEGRLAVRNYRRLGCSQQERVVDLDPLPEFVISRGNAAMVDLREPIHLVWNPEDWKQDAISIHVYSLPYDTCVVYDAEHGHCRSVRLFYTSKFGELVNESEQSPETPFCICTLSPEEAAIHCGPLAPRRT